MERISPILSVALRVLKSRRFAAVILAAATLAMTTAVSVGSHAITVTDGENSHVVLTMHNDPYMAVETAGIQLENYDTLHVDPAEGTVDVNRAMTVEVQADGISTLLHMTDGTVADALSRAGVTVGSYDTINVKQDTPISDGLAVTVDRVQYEEYTVTKSIPFETVTKYSAVLKPGTSKVNQAGVNGVKTITYRKTIVNGAVVETKQVKEAVTKSPVSKIVVKGTKLGAPVSAAPFHIELDEGGQPVKYKKLLTGKCTAYTSDRGDSGKWTSTGVRAQVGVVAVNPKVIPYGTKMWITSADGKIVYGYAVAGDTGGGVRRNELLVDLYFNTYVECTTFGRRTMNVYILE